MSTFHSHMPELEQEAAPKNDGKFSRPQKASMTLSMVLLLYAIIARDLPLAFLLISFLVFMLRPLAEKHVGASLSNAMKGFSVSLGIGAIVMIFL
ncbi:MAG: hypothetical protein IJT82_02985 [Schwartzia sp.]|nr:hypothetical protein [Schwartzia sp. (in: firmicutes)]